MFQDSRTLIGPPRALGLSTAHSADCCTPGQVRGSVPCTELVLPGSGELARETEGDGGGGGGGGGTERALEFCAVRHFPMGLDFQLLCNLVLRRVQTCHLIHVNASQSKTCARLCATYGEHVGGLLVVRHVLWRREHRHNDQCTHRCSGGHIVTHWRLHTLFTSQTLWSERLTGVSA